VGGVLYNSKRPPVAPYEYDPFGEYDKYLVKKLAGKVGDRLRREKPAPTVRRYERRPGKNLRNKATGHDKRFFGFVSICAAALILVSTLVSVAIGAEGGKSVTVNDGGRIYHATTTAKTVGSFLSRNGIEISENDVTDVSLDAPITGNMSVLIRRASTVTVYNEDGAHVVNMLTGTVADALTLAGIEVRDQDEVYPARDTYVTSGMSISIVRVDTEIITETEPLYYKEITKNDPTLAKGRKLLSRKGENGVQENQIKVTYKNGVEVLRETVSETVVKEPVDEITLIGTYVAPTPRPVTPTKRPSGGGGKPSGGGSSGGGDVGMDLPKDQDGALTEVPSISQIHTGTWAEHKAVPPPASSIIKKVLIMDRITGYTHTGNPCSTGVWPKIGTIAANPKQIPYGTKLYVPGYGYGRIEDTGANRHAADYYCCDLFFDTRKEALTWGSRRNVKVYILK